MNQPLLISADPDEYCSTNTGTKMKRTLRNLAILLALSSMSALVFAADKAPKKGYLTDSENGVVKSNFGLCWHSGFWTPADAVEGCDGMLKKAAIPLVTPLPAPAPAPYVDTSPAPEADTSATVVAPAPGPAPAPVAAAVAPSSEKITFEADTFFDFDKSVLKPAGKTKLDDLASKLQGIDIEVVVATGHTDSVGSDTYNIKLSLRRANAVKAFLVSKGIPADRIFTAGKGEGAPIASNKTRDGRAKNRRVEVEVVGLRKK
jgi:OOP family OmpA-OmpF porin